MEPLHDPLSSIFPGPGLIDVYLQIMDKGGLVGGDGERQEGSIMFSILEDRIPLDHPLRPIRRMVDRALSEMSPLLDSV